MVTITIVFSWSYPVTNIELSRSSIPSLSLSHVLRDSTSRYVGPVRRLVVRLVGIRRCYASDASFTRSRREVVPFVPTFRLKDLSPGMITVH